MTTQPEWLSAIRDPGTYSHPVAEIRLVETHISWVILTGDWAYKLKKPVNFGFVNFSTLELRRAACDEEVRLNRRTAHFLYDGVVPLTSEAGDPQFGGSGPVLEYAVRMRQFAQEDLLEQCLARNELSADMIDTLADAVADLHIHAEIAGIESPFATPEIINENVQRCLDQLDTASLPADLLAQLKSLSDWVHSEWQRLGETFVLRKVQGRVRECHGDLHLGNLVRYRGKPTLFDCLEFSPSLRWIDVMSDVAFLAMDLYDKGHSPLAWRMLNRWLEQTGDYEGLPVLKYYLAYRALVRAKVAAIRLGQSDLSSDAAEHQHHLLVSYVELALKLTEKNRPVMILMHGVSGSGKTFVAKQLASVLGAVQIRSDVERKRLFSNVEPGMEPEPLDLYSAEANRKTYLRLQSLARTVIEAGYSVIIDATFSRKSDRAEFAAIASKLQIPWGIVACEAPTSVLNARVTERQQSGLDASDADIEVLQQQLSTVEPLSGNEKTVSFAMDTTTTPLDLLVHWIENHVGPRS